MEHEPEEEVDEATNDPCDNVHDGSVVHGWLAGWLAVPVYVHYYLYSERRRLLPKVSFVEVRNRRVIH